MKRPVTITISHSLGRDVARRRLQGGVGKVRDKLGGFGMQLVEESWQGDTLQFGVAALGQTISGKIEVEDALVRVEVMLPLMLAIFAEKLKLGVEKQAQILLEHKPTKA
ncbi:polyhydroxyalkanoic acid system family protein [Bosea vestrisii]|uniref:polyhydroxyalkanoic acid system family protein n=1 Tax=Bosea vestrisii TaxID=151416 RepID=UPI0024DF40CB|nr:polyhydroxyalkanoic acid system family protein [Bosea vestrisii]WID99026.1 polyhydroxyalkanoic acid system family protein [Bosea vestrisii]